MASYTRIAVKSWAFIQGKDDFISQCLSESKMVGSYAVALDLSISILFLFTLFLLFHNYYFLVTLLIDIT